MSPRQALLPISLCMMASGLAGCGASYELRVANRTDRDVVASFQILGDDAGAEPRSLWSSTLAAGGELTYTVANGRRFPSYRFDVVGVGSSDPPTSVAVRAGERLGPRRNEFVIEEKDGVFTVR